MSWNVKVSREKVLEVLHHNREHHKSYVLEAWAGYHIAVVAELERRLEAVKRNTRANIYISLPQPHDHTDEYDTIIGMLEMSTEDTISLGPIEYRSYVEDKWDWKDRFLATNESYTSTVY